jgi:hypothetical protein
METISNQGDQIEERERDTVLGVLKQIAPAYNDLAKSRNNLLHGTWQIGYTSFTSPPEEGFVRKSKVTKDGLELADNPKNKDELDQLTQKCSEMSDMIMVLFCTFHQHDPLHVDKAFQKVDGRWKFVPQISDLLDG